MVWIQRGGPVMWPLLVLSIWAATVVVERLLFWWRERRRPAPQAIEELLAGGNGDLDPECRLDLMLDEEQRRLERGMGTLDTIFAAAPMLGILGTVLGVIGAFDSLAARANPDPMAVTGGISEALVTTMLGLIVAIPMVLLHALLVSTTKSVIDVLDEQSAGLIAMRSEEADA